MMLVKSAVNSINLDPLKLNVVYWSANFTLDTILLYFIILSCLFDSKMLRHISQT